MSFSEFCNSSSAQSLREKSRRTLKAHVATRTWEDMQNHVAWSGGLQTDSFESGLCPEAVLEGSRNDMKAACKNLFMYDQTEVEQPRHSLKPFQVCCMRFGGGDRSLCTTDPTLRLSVHAARSIYQAFRQTFGKLYKSKLP